MNAPIETCEARDPRGLYKKARAGEIKDFTGVSSPYESPEAPELEIRTNEHTLESSLRDLVHFAVDLSRVAGPQVAQDFNKGSGI